MSYHTQHTTVAVTRIVSAKLGPQYPKQVNLSAVPPRGISFRVREPGTPAPSGWLHCIRLIRDCSCAFHMSSVSESFKSSPGSSGHFAYHGKDHLLDVSPSQSCYLPSTDQASCLGVLKTKFHPIFIARDNCPVCTEYCVRIPGSVVTHQYCHSGRTDRPVLLRYFPLGEGIPSWTLALSCAQQN